DEHVLEMAAELERELPETRCVAAVCDRARLERDGAAGVDRRVKGTGALRLDPDHPRPVADRGLDAGDQPAAADGDDHRVRVGDHATACAWLPAEMVITPRRRSSGVSELNLFSAPLDLNEPVRWKSSHFRCARSARERSVGVRARRSPIVARARATCSRVTTL